MGNKRQYLVSVVAVLLASIGCYAISPYLGYRVIALILLLTVSLLAISFDILPVLLSAGLSAFIWDFFFIPPRFNFHVNATEDVILLIMYFLIALINGGENRERNLDVTCDWCLPEKNAADAAIKSKNYRVRKRHLGIRKPSKFACSRNSKFKKKLDGTVVLRANG